MGALIALLDYILSEGQEVFLKTRRWLSHAFAVTAGPDGSDLARFTLLAAELLSLRVRG